MSKVTIDPKGRIEIPQELREQFSLESGMELEIHAEADGLRINSPADLGGEIVLEDGVPVFWSHNKQVITTEMVNDAIDDARKSRDEDIAGLNQ